MIKKSLVFLAVLISLPVFSFELDTSVDDEIRKNYNPSAIEQSLPALPKTSPTNQTPKEKTIPYEIKPNITVVDKSTAIRIKKGTKFKVKSNSYLSDTSRVGATFKFTTVAPVYQRYITIPVGTTLNAVVTDSHAPQITGNGGLLEIRISSISFNGNCYSADGKVTKANYKKIFLNNIKGKRQYWKGVVNQVNKGENFYKKTRRASSKLSNNPIGAIISPIPTIFGTCVYVVNLIGSPVISIGYKGGKLSIPVGSEFEIKFCEDVYLQN